MLRKTFSMSVLVDTSVWINHLRHRDLNLVALLRTTRVVIHPMVLGELACGDIPNRPQFLSLCSALPRAVEITTAEALNLLEERRLWGRGFGWTDVHLLGSALVSQVRLWTQDRSLDRTATQLRISLVP
jgi:predicted nucleic acid-binding protein